MRNFISHATRRVSRVRQKSKHWKALRSASGLASMMPISPTSTNVLILPAPGQACSALQCINDNKPASSVGNTIMPPKSGSTKLAPPRLPPLPKLRIRRPNRPGENPCIGIMTSVLGISAFSPRVKILGADILYTGCWASSGNAATGCQQLEQSLRACMDAPVRLLRLT